MIFIGDRRLLEINRMGINLLESEQMGTLSEVAAMLPKLSGRKIHPSTLWRWCSRGVEGIRLEHVKLGGRIVTSGEAVQRFSQRLAVQQPADYDRAAAPETAMLTSGRPRRRSAAQRERDLAEAERELAGK